MFVVQGAASAAVVQFPSTYVHLICHYKITGFPRVFVFQCGQIIWSDFENLATRPLLFLDTACGTRFRQNFDKWVMWRLHDPTVRPTGRAKRSVRPVVQQLDRVNGRPTGWSNRLDESNMSNSSKRLNQQLHRWNVYSTVGPTVGPTMQIAVLNQPIESRNFILIVGVDSLIGRGRVTF